LFRIAKTYECKIEIMSAISFEQLVAGYEFPPTSYTLDAPIISKYLEAVGEGEQQSQQPEFVPPLAMAAYTLKAMSESLTLPAGTIHASQDLEFLKLAPVGTTIDCHARVAQKLQRGKLNMLIIEIEALDQDRERVLSGKATLVLPA